MLSALDAGSPFPAMAATDLAAVLRETLEDVDRGSEHGGQYKTADFDVIVPDGMRVAAGRRELGRVLRNYIENALRYGGPPFCIEASAEDGAVIVRVTDHGPGVPVAFVEQLFERFARADTSRSRQTGGTGLGLSIVRALADGWGGAAWFEPVEPSGACFAVRIPPGHLE